MMLSVVALAGVGCLVSGVILALAGAVRHGLELQAAGVGALGVASVVLFMSSESIGAEFRSSLGIAFGLDPLSAFFVAILALVGVPALIFARESCRSRELAVLTGCFLAAMIGLLAARDVVSFLAFWELMTLLPAAAILIYSQGEEVRRSVFIYLAVTHIGGIGVWAALLILATEGAIGGPALVGGPQALVVAMALTGFATKAGLVPFHVWLPRAHPAAPPYLSALMSGVMIKLAMYGLIRVLFEWIAVPPAWAGFALLGLGACSALAGVTYALMQSELKRLLAFSSIENVGIIALAFGASLVLGAEGQTAWAAIAFAGGLLHALNHAVIKGTLFLGAGAIAYRVGPLDLNHLGGLLRRMPWTGGAILIAALAIAGAVPLNGFASEWIALQSLARLPLELDGGSALAGAVALAALGATAALAVMTFVKVIGLVLLGQPRREAVESAVEVPVGMRASAGFLALLCIGLAPAAGFLISSLVELAPEPTAVTASPELALPGTGSLPVLALIVGLIVVGATVWILRGGRRADPAPVWNCGQEQVPQLAWTSAGFTKTLRLSLEGVLRPHREVAARTEGGILQEVSHRGGVPHHFDATVYGPIERVAAELARRARRLQSGDLRAYLLYLVLFLLAMLSLVRLGLLG